MKIILLATGSLAAFVLADSAYAQHVHTPGMTMPMPAPAHPSPPAAPATTREEPVDHGEMKHGNMPQPHSTDADPMKSMGGHAMRGAVRRSGRDALRRCPLGVAHVGRQGLHALRIAQACEIG